MKGETATEICGELESIFYERGPVRELLMDNATSFRAEETRNMLERWGVRSIYRAAWRPSGNGIVERHHRTIKAMAERMRSSPIEAVYWYNVAPKDGQKEDSVHEKYCFRRQRDGSIRKRERDESFREKETSRERDGL